VRNKACLVVQGFSHVKDLDFRKTFAPVAYLEAIRILLAFAASKGFKLYQMDVKRSFLNSVIHEELLVRQPPSFSRTPNILMECTSFQRLYMDLCMHCGFDMLGLRLSY
jgi:hypothetical protein